MRYGEVIRTHRHARGLSLVQLAKKTGTQKGYISGIETGRTNPPSPRLSNRLAKVLGIDPEELLELGWAQKAPSEIRGRIYRRISTNVLLLLPGAP